MVVIKGAVIVCSQMVPRFVPYFGPFEGLKGFKGPQRPSNQIFTFPNYSASLRSTKPEFSMSPSLSVLSQSSASRGGGTEV